MEIGYSDEFRRDYLKIITNIYYFNTKKVYRNINENKISWSTFQNVPFDRRLTIVENLYQKFLIETRIEILNFFNVSDNDLYVKKYIIRYFLFDLPPLDPVRIVYSMYNNELNEIWDKIANSKTFSCFTEDDHPLAIVSPINVND